jgi:Na+-transporting methylmalonyl-CoA/oxaloacetate decarboxylase gamma subunit
MTYITLGLAIIVVILIILVYVLFRALGSLEKKYKKLMRGTNNKNIEEIIHGYMDKVDNALDISNETKQQLQFAEAKISSCIQRFSIVRYKAFDDVGSDLSFSIALLDANNNGVVVTGIYGRNDSTTYAKPIDKGISRYDLSEEEQRVLKEAINR